MASLHDGDFRNTYDVCVIGGGPVGIAVALELARGATRVLLLESGGVGSDQQAQSLSTIRIRDPKRHRPAALTVHRGLGGTSRWWGGRCVELDDLDFHHRPYLAESGWPVDHDVLGPFYAAAHRYLKSDWSAPPPLAVLPDHPINVESWARVQNAAKSNYRELKSSPTLTVALHTTAAGFDVKAESGTVRSLRVKSRSGFHRVEAQYYVLACGGRENARLLLDMQATIPSLFNGNNTTVGRYYMGHLTGAIASIQFKDAQVAQNFLLRRTANGTYTRGRFQLNARMQQDMQMLNTVMWPHNYEHLADGALDGASAVYQFLRLGISQSEGAQSNFSRSKAATTILRNPMQAMRSCHYLLKNRLMRYPHFFAPNPRNIYWLRYHAEHTPLRESRVWLGEQYDDLGMRRLEVDYRYCQADFRSVLDSHMLLDKIIRAASVGTLSFFKPAGDLCQLVSDQAVDGYHQIGLTRMSSDRRRGSVDVNCKVHDLQNLYVAGSSIFPTSGQANPTLPAVAFGLRLAAHLVSKVKRPVADLASLS
jgi:choline dehydrogenase-like flavoprotein